MPLTNDFVVELALGADSALQINVLENGVPFVLTGGAISAAAFYLKSDPGDPDADAILMLTMAGGAITLDPTNVGVAYVTVPTGDNGTFLGPDVFFYQFRITLANGRQATPATGYLLVQP